MSCDVGTRFIFTKQLEKLRPVRLYVPGTRFVFPQLFEDTGFRVAVRVA